MSELKTQDKADLQKVSRKKTRYEKVKGFLDSTARYIVLFMTFPLDIIGAILKKVFGFVDENKVIPRVALLIGVLLTVVAFNWAFMFMKGVTIAQLTGAELAAVIGSILTPIAGLITILIRYGSGSNTDKDDKPQE